MNIVSKPSGRPAGEAAIKGTGSLRKALGLLSSMAAAEQDGLRLTEIVGRTSLDPATAHRMLACLVDEGFLQKRWDKRYRLGPRIFELGLAAGHIHTEHVHAHRPLRRLAEAVGATAVLSSRSGAETVYIGRVDGPEVLSGLRDTLGTRLPIGVGAGGVALLAAMEPARADALISCNTADYRRFGRATLPMLRRWIEEAKARGFAMTESFLRPGVWAMGVVVPAHDYAPDLAVSVVSAGRPPADASRLIPDLRRAAAEMSRAIIRAKHRQGAAPGR